jgi:hypothetical protein
MPRLVSSMRAAWRALWRSRQLDADMQDEMRFHIEMESERLVREQGLDSRSGSSAADPDGHVLLIEQERPPALTEFRGIPVPLVEQRRQPACVDRQPHLVRTGETIDRLAPREVAWMLTGRYA